MTDRYTFSTSLKRRDLFIRQRAAVLATREPFTAIPDPGDRQRHAMGRAAQEWAQRRRYEYTQVTRCDRSGNTDAAGDHVKILNVAGESGCGTSTLIREPLRRSTATGLVFLPVDPRFNSDRAPFDL